MPEVLPDRLTPGVSGFGKGWRKGLSLADLVGQVALCTALLFLYGRLRSWVEGPEATARSNAERILGVEEFLGLDIELWLQQRLLDHGWLVELANLTYEWLHIVVVGGASLLLWLTRREQYVALRNALILAAAVGLVLFWGFPVAPPRVMEGFTDTVYHTVHAPGTRPPGVSNGYAAFPSYHVGWPVAAGAAIALTYRRGFVRWLATLPGLVVGVAVVVTGNHYIVDVLAGAAICLACLYVVWPRTVAHRSTVARDVP